ncbi:MAG TPA: histidine phosphatase family protein [Pyrinomonadaceae bacterium]|nr:histidine phosphatase family protein [Pyrinomonadaceae bacterium]
MKTLLLLRHAKSSWDDTSLSDFERPLNPRGKQTAPFIGELIAEKGWQPDLVLSSPAERAKQTALLAKEAGSLKAEIRFDEKIYEASQFQLLEVLKGISAPAGTVLLVGHNPGMEGLLGLLTGEMQSIPTAALIRISLDIDSWDRIERDSGKLEEFIKPKEEMNSTGA